MIRTFLEYDAVFYFSFPAVIGIDLDKADYGVATKFHEGDIPVFWPCGVTGLDTLKSVSKSVSMKQFQYHSTMFLIDIYVFVYCLCTYYDCILHG